MVTMPNKHKEEQYKKIFEYLYNVAKYRGRKKSSVFLYELTFVYNNGDKVKSLIKSIYEGEKAKEKERVLKGRGAKHNSKDKFKEIDEKTFKDCCKILYELIPKPVSNQSDDVPPERKQWYWLFDLESRMEERDKEDGGQKYCDFIKKIKTLTHTESNGRKVKANFKVPTQEELKKIEEMSSADLERELGKKEYKTLGNVIEELTKLMDNLSEEDTVEFSEFKEKINLVKIVRSFKYFNTRETLPALYRYLLLLDFLKLIKFTDYKVAMDYLNILPSYLKGKDAETYLENLVDNHYSLHETFDQFRNPKLIKEYEFTKRELLSHFLIKDNFRLKRMKSEVDREAFLEENKPKWQVTKNKPNDDQRDAIKEALTSRITLIKGPPGTGKTETILNIMAAIQKCNKTVAVVSSNNSAIENITAKINTILKNNNASNTEKEFAGKYIALGNLEKREMANKSINYENFVFGEYEGNKGKDTFFKDGKWENADVFLNNFPMISSTIHSLPNLFTDGMKYKNQYDYVIIDEASQSDVLVGIVALFFAKNLILVGDVEQLPPVFVDDDAPFLRNLWPEKSKYKWLKNEWLKMDEEYKKESLDKIPQSKSILSECKSVFGFKDEDMIMLKPHYRCHPSIIGFCNEYIYFEYNDKGEKIYLLEYDDKPGFRIAIRWYQGKYDEECPYSDKDVKGFGKTTKRNMKQVTIFMNEEWPELVKIFKEEQNKDIKTSIAFITPYVGQKNAIKKRMKEAIEKDEELKRLNILSLEDKNDECEEESKSDATNDKNKVKKKNEEDEDEKYNIFTIHKAQGREYDIVYVLPVDDGDYEWPWCQKRRLVNVAVSRAIEELRVITSTNMMSDKVKSYLTSSPNDEPNNIKESGENMYFQKLTDYVMETKKIDEDKKRKSFKKDKDLVNPFAKYRYSEDESLDRSFGFIESDETESVFDRHLEFVDNKESSFENCFESEFKKIIKDFKPFCMRRNEKLTEYFDNVDKIYHFDFLFFKDKPTNRDNIILAVEVDGEPHRTDKFVKKDSEPEEIRYSKSDPEKNQIVRDNGGVEITLEDISLGAKPLNEELLLKTNDKQFYFLRLPTDGTTFNEEAKIKKLLESICE